MDLPRYRTPPRIPTEGLVGREGYEYIAAPKLIAAANAAIALQMPLLLTGEAGCGKTDFAWAAAKALAGDEQAGPQTGNPLECYVRSDSRARDLLYHYDALRRFGDAQHRRPTVTAHQLVQDPGDRDAGDPDRPHPEDPRPYIRLQPLGEALMASELRVVLVDEIDKAPRDLPNDLLRELDQGHFEIIEIPQDDDDADAHTVDAKQPSTYRRTMKRPKPELRPFVVVTSNVERQLPDPFLRRCVFFHIPFPEERLGSILRARFVQDGEQPVFIDQALEVFGVLRSVETLTKRPATSELINWVEALDRLFDPGDVTAALRRFKGERTSLAEASWMELPWTGLPALSCLVKLREDLERLEQAG